MADEITIKIYMDNALVTPSEQVNTNTLRYDMHGDALVRGVQNIGTTEEQINVGDIASLGFCYFKNMEPPDAGNYVEVGTSTGVYQIKLRAGQVGLMPLNGTAVYAKANTAAVNLQYFLTEDLS